jgi:signal transduction histidine kinase
MRLADFIAANLEAILAEWETFARSLAAGETMDKLALRDHAEQILRATARDMKSAQTAVEQSDKSKGEGEAGTASVRVDGASDLHAVGRVQSGFDLLAVVAEYRALRASVIRLWRESAPTSDRRDLDDLTRFNESIDQSLTEAIRSYSERVDWSRQMFLAILGHDLRSPLDSVSLSAALLLRTGQLDTEIAELAKIISSGATAMAGMLNDLLDFSAAALGAQMPLSRAPMELQSLCREVVEEVRAANPTHTVRFQPQGRCSGEWDGARLRQVVSNLLGNAVQHGGATGAIDLSVSCEDSEVRLAVHNKGPPIPREVLPSIFNPLVRGSESKMYKQRRAGSIGLGLHIAREIVTAHGGVIDVKSSEEAGTVFTVRLPRNAGDPRRPQSEFYPQPGERSAPSGRGVTPQQDRS